MIERYTLPEMGNLWGEKEKFQQWLRIEILACEAQYKLGNIPGGDLKLIQERASFDVDRIKEIEKVTNHDVLAFLANVAEYVGESSRYIHMGLTSADIVDTAQAVHMVEACKILEKKLLQTMEILKDKALTYKNTIMIGRTHGVHAEPITFGLKMALWYAELERDLIRLQRAKEEIAVGKLSGAVGTFANVDPFVEEYVLSNLGLKPEIVSTQIVQRDRYAYFMSVLAIIGASLEKFATEIRNLQRTEILEVEEGFSKGQKGSSAMPHKKNPLTAERIVGLARVLRSYSLASLESVALWHERDLTNSSLERITLPDATILLDYMLEKFFTLMRDLAVNEDNMRHNLELTNGLIFSQRVLLTLVDKGLLRDDAYALVQKNAHECWHTKRPFKELLINDPEIRYYLNTEEIEELFNYDYHLKNVDYIFRRAKLLPN
jgi:adenylosuccinate lyase